MASDSQTATTSKKPVENKVTEEAKLMEKEIVLSETADVVKEKPVSDSHVTCTKEEKIDQTPTGEPEKESPAVVEEVAAVVKAEESTEKWKDEIGEKVDEQVEHKEPTLVKEFVDAEKSEEKVIDENGKKKLAEQVELEEPILVKAGVEEVNTEAVDAEKTEEKRTMESNVSEEDNKCKDEKKKMVDVSESTDEAIGKLVEQVEPIDVQSVRDVSAETAQDKIKDVEVLEVEPRLEVSEKVETQPEKAKELAPEVEVVKAEETPETTEQAKVELEGKLEDRTFETEESVIKSKDEKTSESGSTLCHEEIVPTNQDSDTDPKKDTEGDASSPNDLIEKAITEEKHVVEETSKDELENASEAKDVVTKLATEDENIKKDTEPAADGKSEESLKETDRESKEEENAANKEEESIAEKVAQVIETAHVVKEGDEPKQQPEVTAKEVSVKQKHSNSIISKVKQSLVKAKKAIIGKSPSSKTISTEESKGEIKAKR